MCRVGLRPLGAMRGQSILWRAECRAQQAPKAASAILNSARFNGLAFRRPRAHSPAVAAERERTRWRLGASRRVASPAAAVGFDLSVARVFAAVPLLGAGRTVLRHVVA